MFLDFGSIAVMLRTKLDELTNQIKERLKDAYSVVRDRHDKINERLKLIKKQRSPNRASTRLSSSVISRTAVRTAK
jgi:site-specific DNA-adenine methylase